MNVTTLFERIAGKQHERRKQRIDNYRELVAAIASGKEPDADEVEATLAHAGKSLEELRQAVGLFQKRTELKAKVAAIPNLDAEQQEVQRQIAKADDALADAEQRHDEATAPLYGRLQQIKATLSHAESAKRELYHTCDDPQCRRLLDENAAEADKLRQRYSDLQSQASDLDYQAKKQLDQADRELGYADADHRRKQAAVFQKQAAALRRTGDAVAQELNAVGKRREQIEQQMRDF